jgi:hypothetical protein
LDLLRSTNRISSRISSLACFSLNVFHDSDKFLRFSYNTSAYYHDEVLEKVSYNI